MFTGVVVTGDKVIAGVVVTGDKLFTGINGVTENLWQRLIAAVNDTGNKFLPVSLTPLNSLLPVSLTPVINNNLRISPRIFEKIQNGSNGILGGLGDTDSWKKTWSRKSRVRLPLKGHDDEAAFLGKSVPHESHSSRSDFGFEFAEIFVFEKRLPVSLSRRVAIDLQ